MILRDETGRDGPTRAVLYLTGAVFVGACLSGAPGRSPGQANGGAASRPTAASVALRLYRVDPAVTDGLRRAMDCPTLAEARQREARIQPAGPGKP